MSKIVPFPTSNKKALPLKEGHSTYRLWGSFLTVLCLSLGGTFWVLLEPESERQLSGLEEDAVFIKGEDLSQGGSLVPGAAVTLYDALEYGALEGRYNLVIRRGHVREVILKRGEDPLAVQDFPSFIKKYEDIWESEVERVESFKGGYQLRFQGEKVGEALLSPKGLLMSLKFQPAAP